MIVIYVTDATNELLNTLQFKDDNSAKAFMLDAMLEQNYSIVYCGYSYDGTYQRYYLVDDGLKTINDVS